MSWTFPPAFLKGAKTLDQLKAVLVRYLPELYQIARLIERPAPIPYGATVRPNGNLRRVERISPTDTVAFAVANPALPREGVELTLEFYNGATGAMGTVTFGTEFKLAGAFQPPAVGDHAVYTFVCMAS